jgi:deoxyhypusine synthase
VSSKYLKGGKILPRRIEGGISVQELIDEHFHGYNAARLKEGARLFAEKMLKDDVTVGLSLSGAMTPAGVGASCIVPLIEKGFLDWIVSTGANLYHDAHYALGMDLFQGSPFVDDTRLREEGVIRIYDIFFDYKVLIDTDSFLQETMSAREFSGKMSSARFHYLLGKYLNEREKILGVEGRSILSAAFRNGLPIYTSSFGDSSIGMNVAALSLKGKGPEIDVSADVNETAAIVYGAKKGSGKSALVIVGGGSPKNFILQTEPHIQEILGLTERGHDYFLQITDARPDTGGLSGATPSEAVSWGKLDPSKLPDSVVCYLDSTVAFPLITAYVLSMEGGRAPRMLMESIPRLFGEMRETYLGRKGD